MPGYTVIDERKIDAHISFIRIHPTDIALTLKAVMTSLSDLAWITRFDDEYFKKGLQVRAQDSINYIANNIIKSSADSVTSDSGEYIVSELARKVIVDNLKYLDVPLADLIKIKDVGNHGFDFYTRNLSEILLFGEAKYNARDNAYPYALEQITRFIEEEQDCSDIIDVDRFFCENSKNNFSKGMKGFIAAFASKKTSTDRIIAGIKKNKHFKIACGFNELICVAVNMCTNPLKDWTKL